MLQLIQRLLGRAPKSQLPPFDFARNRFPAKKAWPPNLRELTEKQQFRFERKFKRRLLRKSVRPTWNKRVTIVQWTLIGIVLVWGVFFHEFPANPNNPQQEAHPFKGLREWTRKRLGGFWTHTEEGLPPARHSQPPNPSNGGT